MTHDLAPYRSTQEQWLKHYYFLRAIVSLVWVGAALSIGQHSVMAGAILLVAYPAWDAAANYLDASRSGGLTSNATQAINVAISVATTLAVIVALQVSMNWVLAVFGVWASLAGLLQLGTALRRWKAYGAQWAMILSGGQSALVGILFIAQSRMAAPPSIKNVVGYASVGAFYFLVSAMWLLVKDMRRKAVRPS